MVRKRTPLGKRSLVFVDCETTGLDNEQHEIIEIAIIEQQPTGQVTHWDTRIRPLHIERAHPKALEVNGYNEADWADAPCFRDVAEDIHRRLRGRVMVGHNVHFDLEFIKADLRRSGIDPRIGYHAIDTIGLAYVWLVKQGLENLRLDTILDHLGLSKVGAHGALKDAEDCRLVYNSFVQQYRPIAVVGRLQSLEEERDRLRRRIRDLESALSRATAVGGRRSSAAEVLMFPGKPRGRDS